MDHVHDSPLPGPDPLDSPDAINEAIRRLAARVGEWTPEAQAELDVLYRRWQAARESADDGEPVPA